MYWIWDDRKAATNLRKHGIAFEDALAVFDDEFHATWPDPHPDGDRWCTIGRVRRTLLVVVHTLPDDLEDVDGVGRIISARAATRHERRAYEEDEE